MKNKNGNPYYTQSNKLWSRDIMTFPAWQENPDIINDYFCLNTCLLNAYNDYFNKNMTPKELNNIIQNKNGYEYLFYKNKLNSNMEEVKKACFNRESYVVWNTIKEILNIKEIIRNYKGDITIKDPNTYFIIKVPYKNTGHYCNIVSSDKTYFDVYDELLKQPLIIIEIIKIVF